MLHPHPHTPRLIRQSLDVVFEMLVIVPLIKHAILKIEHCFKYYIAKLDEMHWYDAFKDTNQCFLIYLSPFAYFFAILKFLNEKEPQPENNASKTHFNQF